MGLSWNTFCDIAAGQTMRSDSSGLGGDVGVLGAGTPYGAIGGGQNNLICAGVNFGSIFGGQNNCVADNFTSILGGTGNTIPAGFPNAHIVGSGIVLGALVGNPGSLHVNNLWMQPTTYCNYAGVAPGGTFTPGTVYVDTVGYLGGPILRIM